MQIPGDTDDDTRHSLGAVGQGGPLPRLHERSLSATVCRHPVALYTHALVSPHPCLRGHDQEAHGN